MFTNTAIEEITIYETEEIPNNCFSGCKSLTTVNIVNDLINLGSYAFNGCKNLTTVNTKNIGTISSYAFNSCTSLTEFTLPEGEVILGDNVFNGCTNLRKIKFGETTKIVSALGKVFVSSIDMFEVNENNPYYSTDGDILYNDERTAILFLAPSSSKTEFTLDTSINEIGPGAFSGTGVVSVKIPTQSDVIIYDYAFANCSALQQVELHKQNCVLREQWRT